MPLREPLPATRPLAVFLVDDHPCVLWGLEKLIAGQAPRLRLAGTASRAEAALAAIRAVAPDVVVLDLDLGGSDGLALLPELLADGGPRVLILTGMRERAVLERALMLGAGGVVLKDAPPATLLRAIERVGAGEFWLDRNALGPILGRGEAAGTTPGEPLTPREHQIVCAIVARRGAKSEVIAAGLHMSGHTLRNHLTTIYRKLEVRNRLELAMFAMEHRLVAAPPPQKPTRLAHA